MLQQEKLIEAEPNHRVRVAGFELVDLEALYAGRIMLEALGIALSVPHPSRNDLDALAGALDQMRSAGEQGDHEAWEAAHRRFHDLLVAYAGDPVRETMKLYADSSERYRHLGLSTEPRPWAVGLGEHEALLAACQERDRDAAVERLARHLARTALMAMALMAPEYEPSAVRTALQLVLGKHGSPKRDS